MMPAGRPSDAMWTLAPKHCNDWRYVPMSISRDVRFHRKAFATVATPVMTKTFRAEYCLPPAQQGGYYFTAATSSAGDNLWACICIHVRQYCLYVAIKGQVQTVFWAAQTKRKQCEHTKISCVVFASLVRPSWGQKPSHFRARKWTLLILSFFQHSPFYLPDLSAP